MKNQKLSIAFLVTALALQPGCKISFGGNPNDELIIAAEKGDAQGVQSALDDGADVNAQAPGAPDSNLQNMAALRQAAQNGHADVVKLLLDKGAHVDIVDSLGVTPFIAAAQNGQLEVMQLLADKGANIQAQAQGLGDVTALLIASQNGHLNVVQYLISKGADVNVQAPGLQNATPVRMAAQNGHLPVVQALVVAGADVNVVDGMGFTPLSIAQKGGHQDVVDFLKSKTNAASVAAPAPAAVTAPAIPELPQLPTPPSPK